MSKQKDNIEHNKKAGGKKATAHSVHKKPYTVDPIAYAKTMAHIAERSQKILQEYLANQKNKSNTLAFNPAGVMEAFGQVWAKMLSDPSRLYQMQMALWQDYLNLWHHTTLKFLGAQEDHTQPVARPPKGDRRFKNEIWEDNALFDYIKQSYLLTSNWLLNSLRNVEGIDPQTAQKVDFYTQQFVNAISPTNFIMTNPEVLRETLDSGGENLIRGLQNLLDDIERGKGQLKISMTDYDAFELGKNIATTKGKVIYQNDLMQLIQYAPTTDTVYRRPLMIVPPWINKYYILDLREENSFVKWVVDQGYTVFILSWVNPDEKLAEKRFEDYMIEGPIEALNQIEKITETNEINAVGYCLGGTLLATTLAYMAEKKDHRITSATFLTTLLDFEEAGELKIFIDESQLKTLEHAMKEKGYLDAEALKTTFNMLRSNDLIWSFVVNNYLLGKEPFPFDLLYWNDDSTNMPASMHSFYLRKMYLENQLTKAGGIELNGVKIDLRKIKIPSYFLSTREDHIAPWRATYAGTRLLSGPKRFTLAASGHIAGVVNPPAAKKYNYWTYAQTPDNPDDWLKAAEEHPGSWWTDWEAWLRSHSGKKVKAREPGCGKIKPLEDAPGSYVKKGAG